MKQFLLLVVLIVLLIGCGKDPSPSICRPKSLQSGGGDSIAFKYDDQARVSKISYYDILGRLGKEDELSYNSNGRLVIITKNVYPVASNSYAEVVYTLTYENDVPKELVAQFVSTDRYTTQFTHDDQGRLTQASTDHNNTFVGGTRYEYDEDGNIPKVYYNVVINQKVTEVLARENLSFDETEKFYNNVPALKLCNEYVYGYLPTRNNCLTAKVYYYSYNQRFVTPQSVTYNALYNQQGLIQSLARAGAGSQLYSGEVLFERVLYNCD